MKNFSPAQWCALDTEALMHVGVNSSLFLGWLDETQEVEVGCDNVNAATCAYMPAVKYTFQG